MAKCAALFLLLLAAKGYSQASDSLSAPPDSLPAAQPLPEAASEAKPEMKAEPKPEAKAVSKQLPAGYMGLWDMAIAAGFHHNSTHESFNPTGTEDTKLNQGYLLGHFQESLLSNYMWARNQDQKVKFGFQETLDLGGAYGSKSTSSENAGVPDVDPESGAEFQIAYEAAFAVVYKVNDLMDAGFSYYPFIASSFTSSNKYAKFRFRYAHYMAEVSAFGKTALDLKYVMASVNKSGQFDRTSSEYIGLTYTGWSEDRGSTSGVGGKFEEGSHFVQLSYGFIF